MVPQCFVNASEPGSDSVSVALRESAGARRSHFCRPGREYGLVGESLAGLVGACLLVAASLGQGPSPAWQPPRDTEAVPVIDGEKAPGDVPAVSPGDPGSRWPPFAISNPELNGVTLTLPEALDKDGDEELSATEIERAGESLRKLDQDNDGVLSSREMHRTHGSSRNKFRGARFSPGGGPVRRSAASFTERLMHRDTDGDGMLTREELPAALHLLSDALDGDKDGLVSFAESAGLEARLHSTAAGPALLSGFDPDAPNAADRAEEIRSALQSHEAGMERATNEIAAQRRREWWLYSMTVAAMMTAVVSFGHLLNFRPPARGRWRDVNMSSEAIQGLLYSLAFIGVLSAFDLFWTTSHAQHNHFRELNPVGGLFLTDGASPVAFKVATVATSVLLLFSLRRFRGAQIASWWMCFVCTLLAFRWLLLSSSFLG